jgi:uncharacterized OB-fold protein
VTERKDVAELFGDPLTRPFWDAARRRRLLLQRCGACGKHELYARPFCVSCMSDDLSWVESRGRGTIYSATTVHLRLGSEHEPPYVVALVELDEGPRLLGRLEPPGDGRIGLRVRVGWRDRGSDPPLPVFLRCEEE